MVDQFFYCIMHRNQYYGRSLVILCLPKQEKLFDINYLGDMFFSMKRQGAQKRGAFINL